MATLFEFNDTEMDSALFRVLTWSRSTTSRAQRHSTIGGYRVVPLPDDPPTMTLTGLYAPAGYVGGTLPVRASNENWYTSIKAWDDQRGQTGDFKVGRMNFGTWMLEGVDYDHRALVLLANNSGIAPRAVSWTMRFVAIYESITLFSPSPPVDMPPPGVGEDDPTMGVEGVVI